MNSTSIFAEFEDKNKELAQIINSDKPAKNKLKESQKVIDEIFKLGYLAGGGNKHANIFDVHIERDKDGNITRFEYSEN